MKVSFIISMFLPFERQLLLYCVLTRTLYLIWHCILQCITSTNVLTLLGEFIHKQLIHLFK